MKLFSTKSISYFIYTSLQDNFSLMNNHQNFININKQGFMLVRFRNSPLRAAAQHITGNESRSMINKTKKSCSTHIFKPFSPCKTVNNPQEKIYRDAVSSNKLTNINAKPQAAATNQSNEPRINHYQSKKINHTMTQNLSSNNIRSTFSPVPFVRKDRYLNKIKDGSSIIKPSVVNSSIEVKKPCKKAKEDKKCGWAPSFIKNKANHTQVTLQDFKIVKIVIEKNQYKQFIAQHKKTSALFVIKSYKKNALLQSPQSLQQFKFYIKNLEINHSLIVRCFGCFHDSENIYIIQQFIDGETLRDFMTNKQEILSQQQIGSKICEILTALTYLNSINFSYGAINQSNIVNSLNICKLKRPQLVSKQKGILFDIWCLGKLTFELITSSKLIDQQLLNECHTIQDVFSSGQIVSALEVGFKKFENNVFSRDLIKFLITTLWEIQDKTLTLDEVWQLDFMRIYKEEDIWTSQNDK